MILFVSGATGGHLYPAIAMNEALNTNASVVVPRAEPAATILAPYQLDYHVIQWGVSQPWTWPKAIIKIMGIYMKKKPRLIIAMGGGICIPFGIVAWAMNIPILSFEQNAIPGRATRAIQFIAKEIITAFESTINGLVMKSKVKCLGNPVRTKYPSVDAFPGEWENVSGKTILIIGGSQGARAINQFIDAYRQDLMMNGFHVIHLTGAQWSNETKSRPIEICDGKYYFRFPYINNMRALYDKASVVLCRAGATTLAELSQRSLPSILVPYPHAMDHHQEKNAIEFSATNNSCVIKESDLNFEKVCHALATLDEGKKMCPPHNGDEINRMICELVRSYLK